jgi:hypothetical protein
MKLAETRVRDGPKAVPLGGMIQPVLDHGGDAERFAFCRACSRNIEICGALLGRHARALACQSVTVEFASREPLALDLFSIPLAAGGRRRMAVPPQSVVRVLWRRDFARGTRDRDPWVYLVRKKPRLQVQGVRCALLNVRYARIAAKVRSATKGPTGDI